MLIKTPSERSCIVCCIACEIDRLNVTRYSSSSTACCVLSAALPFPVSTLSDFNCVTMESCTFVKHLDRPAAWLHITDCSRNAHSHLLKCVLAKSTGSRDRRQTTSGHSGKGAVEFGQFRRPVTYSCRSRVLLICMHCIPF